jgi:O-methyltransferase
MPFDHPVVADYLDLLKKSLTDSLHPVDYQTFQPMSGGAIGAIKRVAFRSLRALLRRKKLEVVRRVEFDPSARLEGKDWPIRAQTMIGLKRLDHLQGCIEDVLRQNIPGDLIECGVWRGGSTIFMRGILKAYGDAQRRVWAADSFEGLPLPDAESYPADRGDMHHTFRQLAIGLDEVKANFARYGLLDEQVQFLPGWFKDTLPAAPISKLAVLRADGDMYESTIQILTSLYPKLTPGGYCIIDDYGAVPACRQATDDYRRQQGISEPVQWIDWGGAYWRRSS